MYIQIDEDQMHFMLYNIDNIFKNLCSVVMNFFLKHTFYPNHNFQKLVLFIFQRHTNKHIIQLRHVFEFTRKYVFRN